MDTGCHSVEVKQPLGHRNYFPRNVFVHDYRVTAAIRVNAGHSRE